MNIEWFLIKPYSKNSIGPYYRPVPVRASDLLGAFMLSKNYRMGASFQGNPLAQGNPLVPLES